VDTLNGWLFSSSYADSKTNHFLRLTDKTLQAAVLLLESNLIQNNEFFAISSAHIFVLTVDRPR
jgi:hypothetical protein